MLLFVAWEGLVGIVVGLAALGELGGKLQAGPGWTALLGAALASVGACTGTGYALGVLTRPTLHSAGTEHVEQYRRRLCRRAIAGRLGAGGLSAVALLLVLGSGNLHERWGGIGSPVEFSAVAYLLHVATLGFVLSDAGRWESVFRSHVLPRALKSVGLEAEYQPAEGLGEEEVMESGLFRGEGRWFSFLSWWVWSKGVLAGAGWKAAPVKVAAGASASRRSTILSGTLVVVDGLPDAWVGMEAYLVPKALLGRPWGGRGEQVSLPEALGQLGYVAYSPTPEQAREWFAAYADQLLALRPYGVAVRGQRAFVAFRSRDVSLSGSDVCQSLRQLIGGLEKLQAALRFLGRV